MIKKAVLLSACLLLMPSCYTMHFSKDSSRSTFYQTSQWHHIGLWGLMEFSDPVNLERICPKDSWESVRVRTGFVQGLVRSIPIPLGSRNIQLGGGMSAFVPNFIFIATFYTPEEVSVSCKKQ